MFRTLSLAALVAWPLFAATTVQAQSAPQGNGLISPSTQSDYFDSRSYTISNSDVVQQANVAQPPAAGGLQPTPDTLSAGGAYPILNAPLYPCPLPNVPPMVGTTVITNPALAPHEMLYSHRNTGLYGPFYHKTYRGWVLTPFGAYKTERRKLTGTTVDVKYKSHISPFALFAPPN